MIPASAPPSVDMVSVRNPDSPDGWRGVQGAVYATRNPVDPEHLDRMYELKYGTTRTALNERFLRRVPRYAGLLEVGCGNGVQVNLLRRMGFSDVVGFDLNRLAVTDSGPGLFVADGLAIPLRSKSRDLVYTSGTLMHIPPAARPQFCAELVRISKRWIWGLELWSEGNMVWTYGGLIPTSWSRPEPVTWTELYPAFRLVDVVCIQHEQTMYCMYLLDMEG